MSQGWIAVDLDGTLAYYDHWRGEKHIGDPIPLMLERVKLWVSEGKDVRIFTARVGVTGEFSSESQQWANQVFANRQRKLIQEWCVRHIGVMLPVTAQKDFMMIELWDDRCVKVEANTGRIAE